VIVCDNIYVQLIIKLIKIMIRLIEEMTPRELLEVINKNGIAFVPVSPKYEWHSFHLPLGTDGIIAEEVSRKLADIFKAVYFRTLPLASDETRSEEFKQQIGLDENAEIFGMNFPTLPLQSEYHDKATFQGMINSRLEALKGSGFRYAFIINHHGGTGQMEFLHEIAKKWNCEKFGVDVFFVPKQNSYEPPEEFRLYTKVGGHAGLLETHQLMAFRPDLIDMEQIPEGELSVVETGILHGKADIPAEFNPRNARKEIAEGWGKSVIENLRKQIEKRLK